MPKRSLELRITDGSGEPHDHGRVQALDLDGEVLWLEQSGLGVTSVPIRAGRATLRGVPAQPLTLRILLPGSEEVPRPHDVPIDLTHPPPEPYAVAVGR